MFEQDYLMHLLMQFFNAIARAAHQREVIEKLVNKAKALAASGDVNTLISTAKLGLSNVRTNLKLPDILYMISQVDHYNMVGQMQFPQDGHYIGNSIVGSYYSKYGVVDPLVVKDFEQEVRDLHAFLYPEQSYEPSDFIKQISAQMKADSR